ncbi:hypothetical protein PCH70_02480 [Pseudomonas cichorii JBC1]|nr:hypothetical protein PCH70_02480 [Pseudomonas cichorii JBC1]
MLGRAEKRKHADAPGFYFLRKRILHFRYRKKQRFFRKLHRKCEVVRVLL